MNDDPINNQADNSTEAWLNSFAPPPPKPKKPIKKMFLLVALVITILAAVIIVILNISRPLPCLSKSDFKDLTGADLDGPVNPKDNFYTFSVEFNSKSAEYKTIDLADEVTVQKVSDFYISHKNKSIIIFINGSYPKGTTEELAVKRIDKIRADFAQAGVPTTVIQANTPAAYEPDIDEGEADGLTTVSVISADKCR